MKYLLVIVAAVALVGGALWYGTDSSVPESVMGRQEQIATSSVMYVEGIDGYYVRPADAGPFPGVVLIHENRGLRNEIKQAAEDLAKEGYQVLAVDLFDGKVLESQEDARAVTSTFDQASGVANMRAAAQYLRGQGASKVASWGWCFGGRQSIELAISGEPLDATVVYYGGGMATTTARLAPISWPVMGVFGDADRAISTSTVKAFEDALNTLGVENEIHMYPGVGHAFANPSNPNHAPEETTDAWAKTITFLNTHLK